MWKPGTKAVGHLAWEIGDKYYSIHPAPAAVAKQYKDVEIPHHRDEGMTQLRSYPLASAFLPATHDDDCRYLGARANSVLEVPLVDTVRMIETADSWLRGRHYYLLYSPRDEALPTSNCVSTSALIFLAGIPRVADRWSSVFRDKYISAFPDIRTPDEFMDAHVALLDEERKRYQREVKLLLPKAAFDMRVFELGWARVVEAAFFDAVMHNCSAISAWFEDKSFDKRLLRVEDVFGLVSDWNANPPPECRRN